MNTYFLIPLTALLFTFLTRGYVIAQKSKISVNRAYLILSGAISVWLIQNMLLWLPVDRSLAGFLIKFNPLFWLPVGFFYLNFCYAFLEKKRDFFYFFILTANLFVMSLCLTTPLMGTGYVEKPWGPQPLSGPIYFPSVLLLLCLPCLYSLFLMAGALVKTRDTNRKNQLILVISGTVIGLSVGLVTDVILKDVITLGSSGGAILSLFIFCAVVKYRFMTIGIEDIAAELFANVQDGVIIVKEDGSVVQINQAARMILNLVETDISQINISRMIATYRYSEDCSGFETPVLISGEERVVSLSQSPVRLANRGAAKLLIIRDVTAYKQAIADLEKHRSHLEELAKERTSELTETNRQLMREISERQRKEILLYRKEELLQTAIAGLSESEERYRTLAENTFDLICETSQDGLFIYASPNHEEITAYNPEELIGKMIFDFIYSDDLRETKISFEHAIIRMGSFQATHRYRHKNGDWLWFESSGKPYRAPDGSIRIIWVLRDMTHRKRIEEEIIKANKLESIGILAGGLAHDFNNILSIIWGNITLSKMYAGEDSRVTQKLANAEQAMIRARDLMHQLLAFAKGGEPVKRTASIADLISESVCLALRGSGIECRFNPPADLWAVLVDEGQMNQVFNNLLINAKQAMPEGGRITIAAVNKIVTAEDNLPVENGRYVEVSFADNGVGIPAENLGKIFDPYFTTKPNGTGLGLATVYAIMKRHRGYITVKSTSNAGSVFHLYIPASETGLERKKIAKSRKFRGHGRVLIMDDEKEVSEVLAKLLNEFGYEAATALDGEEAVHLYEKARLENSPFMFTILDLMVPGGMGGKDTIQALLKINPEVKALVSSGYSNDPVMSNYEAYGFCGVLRKPYTLTELSEALRNLRNRRRGVKHVSP